MDTTNTTEMEEVFDTTHKKKVTNTDVIIQNQFKRSHEIISNLDLGPTNKVHVWNTIAKDWVAPSSYADLHKDCMSCVLVGGEFTKNDTGDLCTLATFQHSPHPYVSKFLMLNMFIDNMDT